MSPRSIFQVTTWLVVLLCCGVPGGLAAQSSCSSRAVELSPVSLEQAEFQMSIPASWSPSVIQGGSRVVIEDADSRCSLQLSMTTSLLTLNSVIRLHETLYLGQDRLDPRCPKQWAKKFSWAERIHLGEYRQRFSSVVIQSMIAQVGDRTVVGVLRCRHPEDQPADWSQALAIFASFSPSKRPHLPSFLPKETREPGPGTRTGG